VLISSNPLFEGTKKPMFFASSQNLRH